MNYVDPVKYSKAILSLMEDESMPQEETIPVKGNRSMKERVSNLSPDDKKKLEEYIAAYKEIKKEIHELINKDAIAEIGGNNSSNLYLSTEEE
jgi:hypothetical protein